MNIQPRCLRVSRQSPGVWAWECRHSYRCPHRTAPTQPAPLAAAIAHHWCSHQSCEYKPVRPWQVAA